MIIVLALSAASVQAASFSELKGAVRTRNETRLTRLLLDEPGSLHQTDDNGMTAIFFATKYGHLKMADTLFRNGAKIRVKDDRGHTPLHWVSMNADRKESVKWLIDRGADVNAESKDGTTPLHQAASFGQNEIATILIHAGANVDPRNRRGETPLMLAGSPETAKALLAAGAKLNAVNKVGKNALTHAMYRNPDVAIFLIRKGIDFKKKDRLGKTALHEAIRQGHSKLITLLIEKGAILEGKNGNEDTILTCAARKGDAAILRMILGSGISKSILRDFKKKALLYAALTNPDTVKLLLSNGAEINARDSKGYTPIHLAVQWDVDAVVKCLDASGAELDVFALAHLGRTKALETMLTTTPRLARETGRIGVTPLHAAAREGQLDAAKLLITMKANVNARSLIKNTPLNLAAMHNHVPLVKLLLVNGADVNITGHNRSTPLHHAAEKGHADVIKVLLANGTSVNAKDNNGLTALHHTAIKGHLEAARALLKGGARTDIKSNHGHVPWTYAHSYSHSAILELLKRAGASNPNANEPERSGLR